VRGSDAAGEVLAGVFADSSRRRRKRTIGGSAGKGGIFATRSRRAYGSRISICMPATAAWQAWRSFVAMVLDNLTSASSETADAGAGRVSARLGNTGTTW
jgi:hypothetical protein